jgi:hypothetical protein
MFQLSGLVDKQPNKLTYSLIQAATLLLAELLTQCMFPS